MGLDADQRVIAFGDFNGDQLCVVVPSEVIHSVLIESFFLH